MARAMDSDVTLSRPEWQAVAVALGDAARCGCAATRTPGPLRRLYGTLTGITTPRPLADPRLEAVRSFVCATRRQRRIAEQHVPALIGHGFNARQVAALARLSA